MTGGVRLSGGSEADCGVGRLGCSESLTPADPFCAGYDAKDAGFDAGKEPWLFSAAHRDGGGLILPMQTSPGTPVKVLRAGAVPMRCRLLASAASARRRPEMGLPGRELARLVEAGELDIVPVEKAAR